MKTVLNEGRTRIDLYDEEGKHVGEIEYKAGGNNELYATHTEVFTGNEGKGYAGILLDALVEYAVGRQSIIKPICPYVIAQFKKDPEKYSQVIG